MVESVTASPTYPAERRRRIVQELRQHDDVAVRDLAAQYGVSASTIRRDLNALERAGLVTRTYGGAAALPLGAQERPLVERRASQTEAKRRIGQEAAGLVHPGETLFLDGGTTVECLVPHLRGIHGLTVVTFGLNVMVRLAGCEGMTVIAIGGVLDHRTLTMGGTLAYELFRAQGMRFDRAFLAASGVSAAGVTNASLDEIPLKRAALGAARETVLLVDGTKIGTEAVAQIAPVERFDLIVTDGTAAPDELRCLRQRGVRVIVA